MTAFYLSVLAEHFDDFLRIFVSVYLQIFRIIITIVCLFAKQNSCIFALVAASVHVKVLHDCYFSAVKTEIFLI